MDYQKIYDRLIERAVERGSVDGYSERHHIIPRSMGGRNDRDNLVDLTAEEHYLAHLLLCKVHANREMTFAAWQMSLNSPVHTGRCNNKQYGWLKRRVSEAMVGENNHMFGLPPYMNPRVLHNELSITIWKMANHYHELWCDGFKPTACNRALGVTPTNQTAHNMFAHFKCGWIPSADEQWNQFVADQGGDVNVFVNVREYPEPWANHVTKQSPISMNVWASAERLFDIWSEYGCGPKSIYDNCVGVDMSYESIKAIISMFKTGWRPKEDKSWLDKFSGCGYEDVRYISPTDKEPWDFYNASNFWSDSKIIYNWWVCNGGVIGRNRLPNDCGSKRLSKTFGCTVKFAETISAKMKSGWNPNLCNSWENKYENDNI